MGYANTAISSSKKISIPDNTILGLQSAYECYATSLANVETSLSGTPYQGAMGCLIDTGIFSTGNKGDNLRSDKRQHGACAKTVGAPSPCLPYSHASTRIR